MDYKGSVMYRTIRDLSNIWIHILDSMCSLPHTHAQSRITWSAAPSNILREMKIYKSALTRLLKVSTASTLHLNNTNYDAS